jgi:hypothetical protein
VRENNARAGPNAIKAQPKKTMRVIVNQFKVTKIRYFLEEKI